MTNIVVGAIVGSDIYVASAITAGLIGPLSILAWIVAGAMASVLAMVLAYFSYHVPRVGGTFAFISAGFDDFYGFLGGWSMWIAEVVSLPVFAITFENYLGYFVQLDGISRLVVQGLFLFGLTAVNVFGVKAAGRLNDVLTIAKLAPLLLLILVGLGTFAVNPALLSNYSPFAPFGWGNFGGALVLIFWAYAGFELGTLPASEVKDPEKTIPRAIVTGMLIVIAFYLLTNFVIFGGVAASRLATTTVPLVLVGTALLGTFGATTMTAGALISVSGSDESGTLGTARLSYAMSIDGLFPAAFARVHPRYQTPYVALLVQGVIAFVLSTVSGLTTLISFAVFTLAFCFLLTCAAFIVLDKPREKMLRGQRVLPWAGIAVCLFLLYSTSWFDKIVGSIVILLGIPLYVYFSPKADMYHLKEFFTSEEAVMSRAWAHQRVFLANLLRMVHGFYRKT
ncbi:MAG: APC family permease [Thermoplasmata archaeon]|nr:APC family permease [Thermoplasmata archaeon]